MIDDLLKLTPRAPGVDSYEKVTSRADAGGAVKPGSGAQMASDFQSLPKENIQSLADVTTHSDQMDRAFAAGKTDNIHEVMVAASHANLALETAMQVRNIAVRAFQTLTQLR